MRLSATRQMLQLGTAKFQLLTKKKRMNQILSTKLIKTKASIHNK